MSPIAIAIETEKSAKLEGSLNWYRPHTLRSPKRGCLYVGALPYGSDKESIQQLFQPYGPVYSVVVYANWENPTFEPHALVELQNHKEAVKALDGKKIGNTYLRVHEGGRHE